MVHRAHKAQALILRRVVLDGGGSFHRSEQREYLLCVLPGIFSLRAEGSIALRNCVPYSQRAAAGAGNAEYPADATTYSFIGLGNTARATMLCLLDSQKNTHHTVQLLKYKDQADSFIERFGAYPNVTFSIIDNIENLISNSDVIISCITDASNLICPKNDLFKEGCLVVPIHTRGFQNCDLFFDKVYGDDTDHVKGFRYFSQFKQYAELEDVLSGRTAGRENDHERILSYNIGLGLHDILFASKIYDSLSAQSPEIKIEREVSKFWI